MNDDKCLVHDMVRVRENTQVSALYYDSFFKKNYVIRGIQLEWTDSDV